MDISSDIKWNLTRENLNMAKKGKTFDISTKQHHKDYVKVRIYKTL